MTKKNVKGEYGYINVDGKPHSGAYMTSVKDLEFWDYIETGIKPLVSVLIEHNIDTFGSCQGHYIPNIDNSPANVRVFVDNYRVRRVLENSVKEFNNEQVFVREEPDEADYDNPTIIRPTIRITFNISPQNREELDSLISKYSEFLNHYLDQKLRTNRD